MVLIVKIFVYLHSDSEEFVFHNVLKSEALCSAGSGNLGNFQLM